MTHVDEFIEDFLQHEYDPVKARAYYLRTRKLKGRTKGITRVATKKLAKKIMEDEVPEKSPSGAKLIDFDGSGSGRAVYSDGTVFDGNGWDKATSPKLRLKVAQIKLDRAKRDLNKIKDPAFKADRAKRLSELQAQLTRSTKLVRSRRSDPRR